MMHILAAYPFNFDKVLEQEVRLFKSVHHLTSSAQFLVAVKARDFDSARRITELNPWAVKACEAID